MVKKGLNPFILSAHVDPETPLPAHTVPIRTAPTSYNEQERWTALPMTSQRGDGADVFSAFAHALLCLC